jgi:hypothetical protein
MAETKNASENSDVQESSKGAKKGGGKKEKYRNWAMIIYPESAPVNWIDILTRTGLPCAISPLHSQDVDPTEEMKKPHYHAIVHYDGPTTFATVKRITDALNTVIPLPIHSLKGTYRYFTHRDHPEKFQYDEREIRTLNGFAISDFVELRRSEVLRLKRTLQVFIQERNILEYCDFMDAMLGDDIPEEYYDVACNNTYFFNNYIGSMRHKQRGKDGN